MVGAVAATTLLLGWAGSAFAQDAPRKEAQKDDVGTTTAQAPATKPGATKEEPKAAPPASGEGSLKSFLQWEKATGDWGGNRGKLVDKGIDIGARLTFDDTRVQSGGLDPHDDDARYWLDIHASLDLKKLAKFPCGGRLYMAYWQMGGDNGSSEMGVIDDISSIESDKRKELAEFYYESVCADSRFRTRLGKFDPSREFNYSEYAGDFMNLGVTFSPAIAIMPRYPDTAVGAEVQYRGKGIYSGIGVFDGSHVDGIKTGKVGALHTADLFAVAEAGYRWMDGQRPVRAAVGYWFENANLPRVAGGVSNRVGGVYALAEGMIWRKNREDDKDTRGAYAVLRFTKVPESASVVDQQYVAALVYKGPLASRPKDSAGLAWVFSDISGDAASTVVHSSEQVLELYYKAQLTPFASLTPDIQYVGNPGGSGRDAVVFGLRLVLEF
jgi:porin